MVSVSTSGLPASTTDRFGRIAWLVPAILLLICVLWLVHPTFPLRTITGKFIDLQVYRLGVQAMWHGADLYGTLPKTSLGIGLPFIYPPFAALALSPFAVLSWSPAAVGFFAVSTLSLAVTLYLVARRTWTGRTQLALWAAACALPLGLLLEPVTSTLDFGQVNLLLMVLVAADCLAVRPRWRRGMLVGLAAAIKLTPAAFVIFFLVRRDYRAAATAAITGTVATAVSYAVLPRESTRYWFGGMGNVSGLSGSAFHTNQSIQGVLSRLRFTEPVFTTVWLLLCVALLATVVVAMRRTADYPPLALAFNAIFTLLASPISWSHHWVWIAPILLAAIGVGARQPGRQALAWYGVVAVTAVVFAIAPHNRLPSEDNRELAWAPWQHLVGDTYVWLSVLLIALYVTVGSRPAPGRAIRPLPSWRALPALRPSP